MVGCTCTYYVLAVTVRSVNVIRPVVIIVKIVSTVPTLTNRELSTLERES